MKIAILSPTQKAYSETFIQTQKNNLKGTVFYYFGGNIPDHLENGKIHLNRIERIFYKIQIKLKRTSFGFRELAFIKSLKENNISIILAQYGTTAHSIVKICQYLKIPLITHFHGFDASIYAVIKSCDNYKDVFEYSSYVIAVSKKMEDMLLKLGCSKDKLVYNANGPQAEFLEVKPSHSKKQFIAIGRFIDKKAPYYTILAFKEVLKKHPDSILLIAGDGMLYNTCENLIQFYNLQNNVKLVGVVSPDEFRHYLSESIAFVQHSVRAKNGDMEGTPLGVLEASAAGLAVISTNHAGIPDIIIDGETGFIVEEHDVKGMAEKMIELLENRELSIAMGKKGKSRIKTQFSFERYINVLDKLFEDVITENNLSL